MSESSASRTTSYKPQPPPTTLNKSEVGTAFLAIMVGGAGATALGVATAPVGLGIGVVVGVGYAATSWFNRKTATDQRFRKANKDAEELFKKQKDLQDKFKSPKSAKERRKLRDQTDQVQQEHIKFTTWLADNNLDLPLPDQPMTEEEYKQTQANWRELCAGKGQIRIPDDASPEFQAEMRAMHASLLSSKQGRRLLEQVLHPKTKTAVQPIKINETPPDPAKTREQRASRLRDRATLLPAKQAEIDGLRKEIETLQAQRAPLAFELSDLKRKQRKLQPASSSSKSSLTEEEQKSRAELENQLAALNEQILPFDTKLKALDKKLLPLEEELGAYGKWEPPPPGLADPPGKVLTLRQGLRDSEIICYGEDDAEILTPAFLVYGHELVHCARRRAGIDNITDLGDSALDRKWGNLEEYGTIHGDDEAEDKLGGLCENKLRADYKLPPRKYVRSKTQDEVEVDEAKAL